MQIKNHRLFYDDGRQVDFRETPNRSGRIEPRYLVMHYTAGTSAEGSIRWMQNPLAKASAHLVIGRDGSIVQMVPFNLKAWHAGISRWYDLSGLNSHSIGIELDNAGKLEFQGGEWHHPLGRVYPEEEVMIARHKFGEEEEGWHTYTEVQLETAIQVAATLMEKYEFEDVLGHEDISPDRKIDPGPAFPMGNFRSRVMGRRAEATPVYETTTALNIRTGPAVTFDRLPQAPLPEGTRVLVLDNFKNWRQVEVEGMLDGEAGIQGWVSASFLKKASD